MNFFDPLIRETETLISALPPKEYPSGLSWNALTENQMILRRDTAFELEGIGFSLVTASDVSDNILLVGDDLCEITDTRRFARISIVQVEDSADERAAYDLIKRIDYIKYQTFPDGYMMRSTSRSYKEAVRISKNAVQNSISFARIGALLIERYKHIPSVKSAKVIFVTSNVVNHPALEKIAEKSHDLTEALNPVLNKISFDCDTCNLKAICDEVDGLKKLHFDTDETV